MSEPGRVRSEFGWKPADLSYRCGHGHGHYPGLKLPRVPGHEVVGRIDAFGSGVSDGKPVNASALVFRRRRRHVRTLQTGRHCELSERSHAGSNGRRRIRGSHDRRGARIASIPDELTSVDPLLFCARGSRPTTLFAMLACAAVIWSLCRELAVSGILVSSLPPHGIPYCRNRTRR